MSSLLPNGKQRFVDNNGRPLIGGRVYYYTPNTSTPKNTWQDDAMTVLNTNPIVLDARGECTAWGEGRYRQVVRDVFGNLIWDKDVTDPSYAAQILEDLLAGPQGASLIGYTEDGIGAVLMSLLTKVREGPSVKGFGAVGDGVTVDTAAFTAALSSPAVEVFVPPGTYLVDSFTVPAGKRLFGPGTLKWIAAASASMITLGGAYASIDGLTVDANGPNQVADVTLIQSTAAPGAGILNCTFTNGRAKLFVSDVALSPRLRVLGNTVKDWGTGVNPDVFTFKSSRYTCAFNQFDNINPGLSPSVSGHCIRTGLYESDPTTNPVVNGTIFGNVFENSNGVGITCELYTQGLSITGNTMRNLNQGVKVESQGGTQSRISIVGNEFVRINGSTAFNLTGSNVIVSSNTFKDCAGYVDLGYYCVCSGNTFDNCGSVSASAPSIRATSSSFANCIVQGNQILNAPFYGVIMSLGGICDGNIILNPGLRGVSVNGQSTKVTNNLVRGSTHQYGIITDSSSAGCIITGNDCSGATTANYQVGERLLTYIDSSNIGYQSQQYPITIVSDAITAPRSPGVLIVLDTEGAAPTDVLSTINVSGGGYIGQTVTLRIVTSARTVTINNAGNLRVSGGSVTLSTSNTLITMVWNGSVWSQTAPASVNS